MPETGVRRLRGQRVQEHGDREHQRQQAHVRREGDHLHQQHAVLSAASQHGSGIDADPL